MIFAWESSNKQSRGFFTPKTLKEGKYKDYKVWFPKLGSRYYDSFGNEWDKEHDVFSEKIGNPDDKKERNKLNEKNRIIFVGLDNGEKYQFAGVFKFDGIREEKVYWKRIFKEFPIIKAQPPNLHQTV